jgi:hypothetical protein
MTQRRVCCIGENLKQGHYGKGRALNVSDTLISQLEIIRQHHDASISSA